MYRALVVDDDKIIRNSIIGSVDWEKQGFELVDEAHNGREALKKIRELQYDLVITDICMPCMDGVQLIQSAKMEFPQVKFIVLSNYDDFCYVKSAMKNGALDYILKYEISNESIIKLLNSAKQEIAEDRHKLKAGELYRQMELKQQLQRLEDFWTKLFDGEYERTELENTVTELGIRLKPLHGIFVLVQSKTSNNTALAEGFLDCIILVLHNENDRMDAHKIILSNGIKGVFLNFYNVISSSQIIMKVMEKISWTYEQKQSEEGDYFTCISELFYSIEEMISNAVKCREMLKEAYYCPHARVISSNKFLPFKKSIDIKDYEQFVDNMLQSLFSRNLTQSLIWLEKLIGKFKQEHVEPEAVNTVLHYLISETTGLLRLKKMESLLGYPKAVFPLNLFDKVENVKAVEREVGDFLERIYKELYAERLDSDNDDIIRAIDYIVRNYSKSIGLQDVADFIGMSKNHFCRKFKKETGENFLDYLNKVRIEHAKQLILKTNLNMNDISQNVGFSDCRYFKQIFFKYSGSFPTELRKNSV